MVNILSTLVNCRNALARTGNRSSCYANTFLQSFITVVNGVGIDSQVNYLSRIDISIYRGSTTDITKE